jgi:ribose 5-phosphate isomerase B
MNGRDVVRRVALGADQSCVAQRELLRTWLETVGYKVVLAGAGERPDYADAALAVCRKVAGGDCERGILLDVSGIGSSIAANKIMGIRAALAWDLRSAIDSRERNNANVLALGGAHHGLDELCAIARAWLEARFDAPRHAAGANRITAIERGGFQ